MDWFDHASVRRKFWIVTGLFLAVVTATVLLTVKNAMAGQRRLESLYATRLSAVAEFSAARLGSQRSVILTDVHLRSANPAEKKASEEALQAADKTLEETWNTFKPALAAQDRAKADEWYALERASRRTRDEVILPASRRNDLAEAGRAYAEVLQANLAKSDALAAAIVAGVMAEAKQDLDEGTRASRKELVLDIAFSAIGVLVTLFLTLRFQRIILGSLSAFQGRLEQVAAGELKRKLKVKFEDEFGSMARTLNNMVDSLRSLVTGIRAEIEITASSSAELSASAEQMSATTQQIASTTDRQRVEAENLATAMTELAASIEEVSGGAGASLIQMEQALRDTAKGDEAGTATLEAMAGISETAGRIAGAVQVIQDIARQTNLLSLNAAIEAAKAGEHGKGFAVVAEEVRKLAERSAVSAKEIAVFIEDAKDAVTQGQNTVEATVAALSKIRASLATFSETSRRISAAAKEQGKAGAEVARFVERHVMEAANTASATTQMSSTTLEVARTAGELNQLAENLQGQVLHFAL